MSPSYLLVNSFFSITNINKLHTDKSVPTKRKYPHTNIVGRILPGWLCQCGSAVFWGTSPFLPGAARAMCAGSSSPFTTAPAVKCSCCYFGISHSLMLLNPLSPSPVVLFSRFSWPALFAVQGTVCRPSLAHPGPL